MTLDEGSRAEADEARLRMLDAQHALDVARSDFHHAIRKLHAAGATMREVATAFGLSHQRVHQIVGGDEPRRRPFPPPFEFEMRPFPQPAKGRRRAWFQRFTPPARAVVATAQEEAHELGHGWVGTEHLLLGIAASESAAAVLLADAGLAPDELRREVERVVESPPEPRRARVPFTRRAKKAFELALREAVSLGENLIGVEHLLIALAREGEGAAACILAEHGLEAETLRARLEQAA
jgi:hypothetical protein